MGLGNTTKGRKDAVPGATLGGATGPVAHVLFDGRLLDANSLEQGKRAATKAEEHSTGASGKASKNSNSVPARGQPVAAASKAAAAAEDRAPPLTPPRVSGVSLAPVADTDELADSTMHLQPPPQQQAFRQPAPAAATKRPMMAAKAGPGPSIAPLPANGATVAKTESFNGSSGKAGAAAQQEAPQLQLLAEGRSIPRGTGPVAPLLDPRLAMYNEINERDSLCGTPPCLSIDVTHDVPCKGPLGPLTPAPLSPSLLTMCMGLGAVDLGADGTEDGAHEPMWASSSYSKLPDIQPCDSPRLPSV